MPIFRCPTMQGPPIEQSPAARWSSYAASIGTVFAWGTVPDDGAFARYTYAPHGTTMGQMLDGTSNTLAIGEMGFQLKNYYFTSGPNAGQVRGGNTAWQWGYASYSFGSTLVPMNTKVHDPVLEKSGLHGFRSDHAGGAQFLFADGSVHFLGQTMDLAAYRNLSTRATSDIVPAGSF